MFDYVVVKKRAQFTAIKYIYVKQQLVITIIIIMWCNIEFSLKIKKNNSFKR